MPGFLRHTPIFFHGLKRSGNHVVLNWIKSGGQFRFFNNVLPLGRLATRPGGINAVQPRWLPFYIGRKTMLISVEDMPADRALFRHVPSGSKTVVLVRDPTNLFASRIRKGFRVSHVAYPREMNEVMQRAVRLWKEHARLCLENLEPTAETLGILFDQWLVDSGYRSEIASWLNINPSDKALETPAREGGGSSFQDSHAGSGCALEALRSQVLNRHADLNQQEHDLLNTVLDDREVSILRDQLLQTFSSRNTAG